MKKKKILFVDHTPFIGGAQLCLAAHLKYIDRRFFEPFLLIAKSSPESIYQSSKTPILKIDFEVLKRPDPKVLSRLLKTLGEFGDLAREIKPEIVVANTTRALVVTALAKNHYRLISYLRDYDYPKWLFWLLKPRVDKFLAVSNSIKNHYRGQDPLFEVVYLGSEMGQKLAKVKASQVKELRAKLGLKNNDLVVGFVGRLVGWKGPLVLLEAVKRLKNPQVKLVIFGSGGGQSESIENQLKEKIKQEHLEARVKLAGFISNQALIYKMINIFVLPSQKPEPFATTVVEAAFAKLPIIATDIGGTAEFVSHGQNGLLVETGSSEQMAQALLKLSKEKDLAKKLAKQAFLDAQQYSEEKLADKLGKIYENCSCS